MNQHYFGTFISLINKDNERLYCDTCFERIEDSYITDCDNDSIHCDSNCLTHSIEFNLAFNY